MIIDENYQVAPIGSYEEMASLEELIQALNNDQLIILLLASNHEYDKTLWYDLDMFKKWVEEDFFDNIELVASSERLIKFRFDIDFRWLTKNSNRLFAYITTEKHRFFKIHQLRNAIIQHLAKNQLHNSRCFLLFSAFILDSDLDIYQRYNSELQLIEWANFEFTDNQSFFDNSQTSEFQLTSTSNGLIGQYINENDIIKKNHLFWCIKWKFVSGNYSSLDLHELSKSNGRQLFRLFQYLHVMRELDKIDMLYMEEVLKWPITEYLKTKFQKRFFNGKFSTESPLKKHGYVVGNTSNTSYSDRQQILTSLFLTIPRDELGLGWGEVGTPRRLYSITWHIARNIWRVMDRPEYSQAVEDWRSDLNFLRDSFYLDKSVTEFFQWPVFIK